MTIDRPFTHISLSAPLGLVMIVACVPMTVSDYVPSNSANATIYKNDCNGPGVSNRIPLADGISLRIDGLGGVLAIDIKGSGRVRFTRPLISILRPNGEPAILGKIGRFGGNWQRFNSTAVLQGPGQFLAFVDFPRPKSKPDAVSLELPPIEVNDLSVSLPPIEYRLERKTEVVWANCP